MPPNRAKLAVPPKSSHSFLIAKKSGGKYTALTKIESNVIKKPSVFIMAKLAKAFDVSIEELLK